MEELAIYSSTSICWSQTSSRLVILILLRFLTIFTKVLKNVFIMHLGRISCHCITFLQQERKFEAEQPTKSLGLVAIITDQPSSLVGNHNGALLKILNIESISLGEKHLSHRQHLHISPSRLELGSPLHEPFVTPTSIMMERRNDPQIRANMLAYDGPFYSLGDPTIASIAVFST